MVNRTVHEPEDHVRIGELAIRELGVEVLHRAPGSDTALLQHELLQVDVRTLDLHGQPGGQLHVMHAEGAVEQHLPKVSEVLVARSLVPRRSI